MWPPRCSVKGPKVYYILGWSFDLCRDVLPLLSGEDCFWLCSSLFRVEPSAIRSEVYVLNISLSLLLSVKISLMKNMPYALEHFFFAIQLKLPLVASGGIFEMLQIL